jgi:molecular chaperone IbpA
MASSNGLSRRSPTSNSRQEMTLGSEHPLNFNSPVLDRFFNSSIGFNEMFDRLFEGVPKKIDSYPPYNLFKYDDGYLLEMAVAGFSRDNINIYRENGHLVIEGTRPSMSEEEEQSDSKSILHQGLALRCFKQVLRVSDLIEVQEARLEDGILRIKLEQVEPDPPDREYIQIG